VHNPALQRSWGNEPGAAVGNHHESGEKDDDAGDAGGRGGGGGDIHGADGRRRGAEKKIHRGQRAQRAEPRPVI